VALEYADGGELFDAVAKAGKLPEIEVRMESGLGLGLGVGLWLGLRMKD